LYKQIKLGNYSSIEELIKIHLFSQIDYNIIKNYRKLKLILKLEECEKFNEGILNKFLSISSYRKTDKDYVYDGPLEKGFEMELLLGFPTSGKSSIATEPDSKKKRNILY